MKKLFICAMMCAGWHAQAQFHDDVKCAAGGGEGASVHKRIVDIQYEVNTDEFRTLHAVGERLGIFHYDGAGLVIDEYEIHKTGIIPTPVRVIHDAAGNTNVLFYAISPMGYYRFALVQYDAGGINWELVLANTPTGISCEPTDMDMDANGNFYITGINRTGGVQDIFVALVDNTGAFQWLNTYPRANRYEHPFNISCYGNNLIYIGATSISGVIYPDTRAMALEIDNAGAINFQTEFLYGECNVNEIVSTTVRRQGGDIYVFSPSIDADDLSPGCLSWIQLDNTFTVMDDEFYDPELVYYQPKFEFTDNGNILSTSGHEDDGTSNKYYATYNTTTAGLYNQGGFRYPFSLYDPGKPHLIRTAWSSNTNDLLQVMDWVTDPTYFHTISSDSYGELGYNSCDEVLDHNLCDCTYDVYDPGLSPSAITTSTNDPNMTWINKGYVENNVCSPSPSPRSQITSGNGASGLVYPNPATTYADIYHTQKLSKIEVLDISGKILFSINPNSNQYKLDVTGFETGTYFVRVIMENNKQMMRKLIKQ